VGRPGVRTAIELVDRGVDPADLPVSHRRAPRGARRIRKPTAPAAAPACPRRPGAPPHDGILWEHAGILRTDEQLVAGLGRLDRLRAKVADLAVGDRTSRSYEFALNLGFGLIVAEAIPRGARRRIESRGAHYRTDHPESDPQWRCNFLVERDSVGAMALAAAPVGSPSDEVQAALDADHELDYHQLE